MRLALARLLCKIAHYSQKRKYTGDPYSTHPIRVSLILKNYGFDEDVLIAGILHDTVEDTWLRPAHIRLLFGKTVESLVEQVTDVSTPGCGNRAFRKNLDKEHLMKADYYGKSIKLADLIDNSTSIGKYDPNFAKIYMSEKRELIKVLAGGSEALLLKATNIVNSYYLGSK